MNFCGLFFRAVGESKLALKTNLPVKAEFPRAKLPLYGDKTPKEALDAQRLRIRRF